MKENSWKSIYFCADGIVIGISIDWTKSKLQLSSWLLLLLLRTISTNVLFDNVEKNIMKIVQELELKF